MESDKSLDEHFEEEVETTETTETTGEEASPPEEEKPKESTSVPIAALEDERRKRQQLQRENEELKGKLPAEEDEEPDPYEDPEAYKDFHIGKHEAKRAEEERAAYIQSVEESREVMLAEHDDYLEGETIFGVLAKSNPELNDKMLDSENPAKYAYDKGMEWKAEQKAIIIAELKASGNYTEKQAEKAAEEVVKPQIDAPSLATATASGTNSTVVEKEEGIDEMFENQAY